MKLKIIISFLLIAYNITAQTNIGVNISLFQSSIEKIMSNPNSSHGFSGAPHTTETSLIYGNDFIFKTELNKLIELEYGLGYIKEDEKINFEFFHPWYLVNVNRTLNVDLHYIQFPIGANFKLYQPSSRQFFLVSLGITPRALLYHQDNYQEIIFEEIGLPRNPYRTLVFNANISIGYRIPINNLNYFDIFLCQAVDVSPFVKEGQWGFYEDLYTARNNQLGIKLRFYFSQL